jgi:hypothetical protein
MIALLARWRLWTELFRGLSEELGFKDNDKPWARERRQPQRDLLRSLWLETRARGT